MGYTKKNKREWIQKIDYYQGSQLKEPNQTCGTENNSFSNNGFTLIEVIIGFVLLGILIQLFLSSYVFLSRRITDWKNNFQYSNEINIINSIISEDLFNCDSLRMTTGNELNIFYPIRKKISYLVKDSLLYRNKKNMMKYSKLKEFKFIFYTTNFDSLLIDMINIDSELSKINDYTEPVNFVKYKIISTNRKKEFEIFNTVKLRNPELE